MRYKELWDQLEIVPPGTPEKIIIGTDGVASKVFTGGSSRISKAVESIIRAKATAYLMTLPGDLAAGGNSINKRLIKFLKGEQCSDEELQHFNTVLDFRYNLMRQAIQYVTFLGLNFVDCQCFDVEHWMEKTSKDKSERTVTTRSRYRDINTLLGAEKLFDSPTPCQGAGYLKPRHYLAIALAESPLTMDQIRDSVAMLLRRKSFLPTIFP